jgi:N-acyl amino acid synthase of PEP-CTERM/exosortase system
MSVVFQQKDVEVYQNHFNVILANTSEIIQQVYRLRYQVYCIEHKFEDPAHHLAESETDQYDCHSAHVALIHRSSGEVCGCARVILPMGGDSLPISALIGSSATSALSRLPKVGEVSRYAVSKAFRRRFDESEYPDVNSVGFRPGEQRRMWPHITLGLMSGIAMISKAYGISHLAAVMSPALLRVLRNCGMEFLSTGPLIDHHGMRQPCIAAVDDLLAGVARRNPDYFKLINSGLLQSSKGAGCHKNSSTLSLSSRTTSAVLAS